MKKGLLFLCLILFTSMVAAQNVTVTINVNMDVKIQEGAFKVGTDKVVFRGNFQVAAGDASDWGGTFFEAKDPDANKIYTVVLTFPAAKVGTDFEYKAVIVRTGKDDWWEGVDNRKFKLASTNMTLPTFFFENDEKIDVTITNTINIFADLTKISGTGVGYFDPATDDITVRGFAGWDGDGVSILEGSPKMTLDQFQAGTIYVAQLKISGPLGGEARWKFKAGPDNRFFDNGWETGLTENRRTKLAANNGTVNVGPIVPGIIPAGGPLKADVTYLFQVNMKKALNAYNKSLIPLDKLEFVGMKGEFIAAWAGNWVAADTASNPKGMIVMNDKGKLGDKVAGDNIYSVRYTFKKGETGGAKGYKYGAQYPGITTISASSPMDNEAGFADNHQVIVKDATTVVEVLDNWKSLSTTVEKLDNIVPSSFVLSQNYPNPFNPTTKIQYQVPKSSYVTLRIYNTVGEEIATVVNQEQTAGVYEVTFNPYGLSSGLYFYTLTSNGQSITKKMMFLK